MKTTALHQALTIEQVLVVFDSCKDLYIQQHAHYREGDFEHVHSHIKNTYVRDEFYPQSRDKALSHAKQRVVAALNGTAKQYAAFA